MLNQTSVDTTDEVEEMFEQVHQSEEEVLSEIKKRSVSGAASYLVRTLLLNMVGIVTNLILMGYLSVEDFGIYGFVTQFLGLFVFFSDIGLAAALVQKKTPPTRTDYRTAFTIQQILSWSIFIGFMILSATGFVQHKTGPVGTWLLLVLGLSFPLASLETISAIKLERSLDFNKLVIPQIFETLTYSSVLIFFAFHHAGVQSYVYAILARSLIGAVVMYSLKPWRLGLALSKDSLKTLVSFGAKFQLNDFLARVKDQFFYIALGYFLPLREFGYIQWSKNWSMYPYNLTVQNIVAIMFPTFSRLQKHPEALGKAIDKSVFFITLAIFPILVGMSIFIFPLVHVVAKYGKWQPAVWSLVFFSLSIAWGAVSTPLTNTLNAIGHINTSLKLMLMWTALTWIITPLLVWKLGFNGVAVAALLISFTSVFSVWAVQKLVSIHILENSWRQMIACLGMVAVTVPFMSLWSKSLLWMFVGAVLAGLAYVLAILAIGWRKLLVEVQSLKHKSSAGAADVAVAQAE